MRDDRSSSETRVDRRHLIRLLVAGGAVAGCSVAPVAGGSNRDADEEDLSNPLLWATAWKQTAAEYQALCYQAYNLAQLRLDLAISHRRPGEKPLAVITDVDDTILHAANYWGHLIEENKDFFDDAIWDEWLPHNLMTPVPGAIDFFRYCENQHIDVFYVTNRDQGERTFEYALNQLTEFGFPFANEDHLFVFRDTSDKTPARLRVEETHSVALMIGDNLNDYQRDYYVKDVIERRQLMQRDRDQWGDKFILLPNPTDGHWVRAIFGDSEPAATDANRRILKAAATLNAWDGGE